MYFLVSYLENTKPKSRFTSNCIAESIKQSLLILIVHSVFSKSNSNIDFFTDQINKIDFVDENFKVIIMAILK